MMKVSNALRKVGIDLRRKLFKSVHDGLGGNLLEVVCGGAPIPVDTAYFFDAIGIMILNGYGITECSPLVSVNKFILYHLKKFIYKIIFQTCFFKKKLCRM